ncbi:polysaccharide pyruvyl transferase family protein [Clostridium neonatale]|uniref:polysaccharide pyruvyl transferase family protein n=1 Tax=Clostridium neonatale TaxID=137838 RepID=UPI003D33002C
MKIGIITIFDPWANYGNKLQNYAVCKVINKMNFEVKTLYVENQANSLKENIKFFIHKNTKYYFARDKNYWRYGYLKIKKFDAFNNKYIPNEQIKSFDNLSEQYDYFVIGSDQVWNPSWYDELKKEAFLLTFARPEQKVCFSPSFGLCELPNKWKGHFKNALKTFPNISVREEAGAKIVKELTGKAAEVLIDPTLMLEKEEWIKIESKPKGLDFEQEYILTYFLGDKTKKQEEYIKKIADDNRLVIYNLLDYSQAELCTVAPSEFIYLIHNAKIVFTDSFHACVFSFIFAKPFQVFHRNGSQGNMMSRIETLLNKFSLQRKLYGSMENDLFECNYSEGYRKLSKEKDKVHEFLKKSLCL